MSSGKQDEQAPWAAMLMQYSANNALLLRVDEVLECNILSNQYEKLLSLTLHLWHMACGDNQAVLTICGEVRLRVQRVARMSVQLLQVHVSHRQERGRDCVLLSRAEPTGSKEAVGGKELSRCAPVAVGDREQQWQRSKRRGKEASEQRKEDKGGNCHS